MSTAQSVAPSTTFTPSRTQGHVLCCLCGLAITPNPTNMCVNCIRSQVDITEGIAKQVTLTWCKECGRYLQPPRYWLRAEPESKELLTFCLKKIKGLQKVKLIDAGFIWTEPHSRRLKVKAAVQAEVLNGAVLQQTFVTEFLIHQNMCPDCTRANVDPNVWTAVVQVRQHLEHKRTFFYLEQLILRHNVDANCLSVKEKHEGVDFFFSNRAHATKFIDFLQAVVPIKFRHDKSLVSHNIHTASYNYKYTFSVEIVPICKDDLICIPQKMIASTGNLGPLVLVTRVTNNLTLTDPVSLRSVHLDAAAYWRLPFKPVLTSRQLSEYVVLDVEPSGNATNKFVAADIQATRAADLGANDRMLTARSHLGAVLHPGDAALGYDLYSANLNDPDVEQAVARGLSLPDVVLVKRSYEEKRRKHKNRGTKRAWKLKRMVIEQNMEDAPQTGPEKRRRDRGGDRTGLDMEAFMQDLEEDAEMRSKIAVYKDPEYDAAAAVDAQQAAMTDDEDDEGYPGIPTEELIDQMNQLELDAQDESDGGYSDGEDAELEDA